MTLALPFFAFGNPPIKEMVLYFPLAATGQTQVKDFSGTQNNGVATSIVVSNSASLVSMQKIRQLTIAVWIKPASMPTEFPVLLSKGWQSAHGGLRRV